MWPVDGEYISGVCWELLEPAVFLVETSCIPCGEQPSPQEATVLVGHYGLDEPLGEPPPAVRPDHKQIDNVRKCSVICDNASKSNLHPWFAGIVDAETEGVSNASHYEPLLDTLAPVRLVCQESVDLGHNQAVLVGT